MTKNYVFFLGGRDLEMLTIASILSESRQAVVDKDLRWGAKASDYNAEIAQAVAGGQTPVLVELELDVAVPEGAVIVDHHGDRAGEEASILQVLSLLGIEPTRRQTLIEANDSGYIPAMLALGATAEEVAEIRLADRSAQGITFEQESEAERAITEAEVIGRLTVVRMAHSKTATVTDRLFDRYDQLIILSGDGEVNFFGRGDICSALKEKFEGWNGGSGLGQVGGSAYWGGYPSHDEVLSFVKAKVNPVYAYAILDPRSIPVATEANDKVFATGPVVGIEVTVPALASRCVANIDPQHSGQNADLAAIEVALTAELPAVGSVLATVRADLDSVGAMAIFALRAEGSFPQLVIEGEVVSRVDGGGLFFIAETIDRILLIATSDKFSRGGWPGPKSLPTTESLFDDSTASAESDSRLAPIAAAVSDFKVAIADRVELLKKWLLTGEEPADYRERWLAERQALAKAIADGTIKASTVSAGRIAKVVSTHRAATSVGYSLAPVVIALNPEFRLGAGEPHSKFTICAFEARFADIKAALTELNELESGWGGSPTIGGSPQGVSSVLTIDQVVEVVERHLK